MRQDNPFEWFYQVGNIVVEDGQDVPKELTFVSSPEEAERLVKTGRNNFARRFRCDKKLGMVDEERYDHRTNAWI